MVRVVVSTMSASAVSMPFPVHGPRKGGHCQKSGGEPHGEHEDRPLAHDANSIFTRAADLCHCGNPNMNASGLSARSSQLSSEAQMVSLADLPGVRSEQGDSAQEVMAKVRDRLARDCPI